MEVAQAIRKGKITSLPFQRAHRLRVLVIASCSAFFLNSCGHNYKFYLDEGDSAKEKAKYAEAASSYQSAMQEAKKEKTKKPLLDVLLHQAELKRVQNQYDDSLKLLEEAADVTEKVPDAGSRKKAIILTHMASIYLQQNQFKDGLEKLKEALQLFDTAGMTDSTEAAETMALLGTLYSQSKNYKQGDKYLRKAVSVYERNNNDPSGLSKTLYALENNCRMLGQEDEANQINEKARNVAVTGAHDAAAKHYVRLYQ